MHSRVLLVSVAVAGALSAPALAESPRFYFGAGVGTEVVGGDLRTASESHSSGDGTSLKAFAGVGLTPQLAVELAYHDFGSRQLEGVLDFGYDLDLTAYSASALWIFPLRRVDLFVKGGWMKWNEDGTTTGLLGELSHDASDSNLLYGGGIRFGLGERFGLRGEWERFDFDASAEDSFSAGVELRF